MGFYVIKNNDYYTCSSRETLQRLYPECDVKELPEDFAPGKYIVVDNELVLNPDYPTEHLQKAKQEKVQLNDTARDEALYGGVTYQNVLFDSDTDQKINLLATVGMMSDSDTITWYGMDNQGLLCTKADIEAIGQLIIQLHSYCWNMNAYIKEQIQEAQTIEEVEAIVINYTMPEEEEEQDE